MKRHLPVAIVVAIHLYVSIGVCAPLDDRPNIVFILADDLGWCDVARGPANPNHGSDFYETPAITELASRGRVFHAAYSAGANCAPTRAAILSGQYAPRHRVYSVGSLNRGNRLDRDIVSPLTGADDGDDIPADTITIAERLRDAGYVTAHVGKYHVGGHEGGDSTLPSAQGFSINIGGGKAGAPGTYHADTTGAFGRHIGPLLDEYAEPGTHLTDAVTNAALDFIDRHADRPFFLHVGHYAVHTPIAQQGRRDLVERYRAKLTESPGTMGHDDPDYAALVHGFDESLGAILARLRQTQDGDGRALIENTIIIFTSDNGSLTPPAGRTGNGPLRGQKGEYHEGGIRVPLIIAGPSIRAGSCNTPVISVDFYPTLLDLAKVEVNDEQPMDGASLVPLLLEREASLAREAIYWHFPGYLIGSGRDCRPVTAVRHGRWKLMHFYEDGRDELYDLNVDPGERIDLSAEQDETRRHLRAMMRTWLQETGAALPTVTMP